MVIFQNPTILAATIDFDENLFAENSQKLQSALSSIEAEGEQSGEKLKSLEKVS